MRIPLSNRQDLSCRLTATGEVRVGASATVFCISEPECAEFIDSKVRGDRPIYYVYRHVHDTEMIRRLNIKFDITAILPNRVGDELPRTRGHYHTHPPHRRMPYFDIYQVMVGSVVVQVHRTPELLDAVYLIYAEAGDILCMPPDMCHVVYNPTGTAVALSNWCTLEPHLDYATMKSTRGPALCLSSFTIGSAALKWNSWSNGCGATVQAVRPKLPRVVMDGLGVDSDLLYDWADCRSFIGSVNDSLFDEDWINSMFDMDAELTRMVNHALDA